MLNRTLIFIVCISMVGVTVLPASLLPCCCKFEGVKMRTQGAFTGCPLHKASRPVLPQTPRQGSCCSDRQIVEETAQPTCCSQQVSLQKPCGKCRCLEQMQVVTLSGYSVGQVNMRTTTFSVAAVTPQALLAVDQHTADVIPNMHAPKNVVLLKTCTLLI